MKIALVAYVVLLLGIACLVGSVNLPRLLALSNKHVTTYAVVVKLTPEIHNTFSFSFLVNNKDYSGTGSIYRDLHPGQRIRIIYSPDDPRCCTAQDLAAELNNELIFVGLAATVMPAFALFNIHLAMNRGHYKFLQRLIKKQT